MPRGLEEIISSERLGPYLRESGFNLERALALYAWNMRLGSAFLPLLSSAEIGLRNLISRRLVATFGPTWWADPGFLAVAGSKGKGIVKRAENTLSRNGHAATSGRMTAELSFGFWENMLLPKYLAALWTPLHPHFPDLPASVDLTIFGERASKVCGLRNRIFHHEQIFQRNISQDYAECLEFIGWLSSTKAGWIKPQCDVMKVMRGRP